MEITIVDLFFAVWGGVMTALWVTNRKEIQQQRWMMVELVKDIYEGNVEIVKKGDTFKLEAVKK